MFFTFSFVVVLCFAKSEERDLHTRTMGFELRTSILNVWANPTSMPLVFLILFFEWGGCGSEVKELIVFLLLTKEKKK